MLDRVVETLRARALHAQRVARTKEVRARVLLPLFGMTTRHAAVWIDHHEAKVFYLKAESFDSSTFEAPHHHVHRHPIATAERHHPAEEQRFYHDVARALDDVEEVLVVGPASAKLEFIKHVHKHDQKLISKIIGVETVDHPSDKQLVAHARTYFRAADGTRG